MITHPHPHPRIFFTVFIRAPSTFSISLLWLRPDSKRRQLSVEDPDGRVLSPVMGYLPAEALRKIPDKGWPEGSCGSPREKEDRLLRVKMSDVRNRKGFSRKLFQRFPLVLYTFSLHRPYAEYIVMTREKPSSSFTEGPCFSCPDHYYLPLCLELSVPWKPFKPQFKPYLFALRLGKKEWGRFCPTLLLVT